MRIRSSRCVRAIASCTTDCHSRSRRRSAVTRARRAGAAKTAFDGLTSAQKAALMAFLDSL
jgi:hypothetical protein